MAVSFRLQFPMNILLAQQFIEPVKGILVFAQKHLFKVGADGRSSIRTFRIVVHGSLTRASLIRQQRGSPVNAQGLPFIQALEGKQGQGQPNGRTRVKVPVTVGLPRMMPESGYAIGAPVNLGIPYLYIGTVLAEQLTVKQGVLPENTGKKGVSRDAVGKPALRRSGWYQGSLICHQGGRQKLEKKDEGTDTKEALHAG